jgi:hypothetical protein
MELPRPHILLQGITVAGFGMPQGKGPDSEILPLVNYSRLGNLPDHNLVVDIHIQHPAACLDVLGDPGRPDNVEGIVPIHLGGKHEEAGYAGYMIRVGMAYKNDGDFFPPQVEPPQGDLGALAAVKQEKFPLPPQEDGGKVPVGQGHHAPGAQNKSFKIHRLGSIPNSGGIFPDEGPAFSGDMESVHTTIPAREMAFTKRKAREGLIFHPDRGVQYCAKAFRGRLEELCPSVRRSMGGKGNCRDKAWAESFFKILKREKENPPNYA